MGYSNSILHILNPIQATYHADYDMSTTCQKARPVTTTLTTTLTSTSTYTTTLCLVGMHGKVSARVEILAFNLRGLRVQGLGLRVYVVQGGWFHGLICRSEGSVRITGRIVRFSCRSSHIWWAPEGRVGWGVHAASFDRTFQSYLCSWHGFVVSMTALIYCCRIRTRAFFHDNYAVP